MPEFHLDPGNLERHAAFDALPDIARGYLEAAFFTGLTCVFPDPDGETELCDGTRGRQEELDGLGLDNLDAESFEAMAADAARFWIENATALAQATASGDYDLEAAGRDFWFTRNGHGVGFWDRGLGDAGDELTTACDWRGKWGEIYLFAEPLDPDKPDAGDPDGWTVSLDQRAETLSGPERAALAGLEAGTSPGVVAAALAPVNTALAVYKAAQSVFEAAYRAGDIPDDSPIRTARNAAFTALDVAESAALEALERFAAPSPVAGPLPTVGGRYGAPLGRSGETLDRDAPNMAARRVTLDPGGYDSGGAYWGLGAPLWRVYDGDGGQAFFRASTKGEALGQARADT